MPLEASTTGVLTLLENEVAAFRSCLRALVGVHHYLKLSQGCHQKQSEFINSGENTCVMSQCQFVKVPNIGDLQCCSLWTPFSSTIMNTPTVLHVSFPERHSNILILTVTVSIDYVVQPDTVTPPSFTDPKHCNCIFYVHIFTSYTSQQPNLTHLSHPSHPHPSLILSHRSHRHRHRRRHQGRQGQAHRPRLRLRCHLRQWKGPFKALVWKVSLVVFVGDLGVEKREKREQGKQRTIAKPPENQNISRFYRL